MFLANHAINIVCKETKIKYFFNTWIFVDHVKE